MVLFNFFHILPLTTLLFGLLLRFCNLNFSEHLSFLLIDNQIDELCNVYEGAWELSYQH